MKIAALVSLLKGNFNQISNFRSRVFMEGKNCVQMSAQHKPTVTMYSNVQKVKRTIEKKKYFRCSSEYLEDPAIQFTLEHKQEYPLHRLQPPSQELCSLNSQVLLAFQLTFCHECGSCLVGTSRYFDKRNVVNVSVSGQIGLLSLLDTEMTAHEH